MTGSNDDDLVPPPGGFYHDPVAAGPEDHEVRALERIADALEALHKEVVTIRQMLGRQG